MGMSVICQRVSSDLMWKTITNRNILQSVEREIF